MFRFLPGPVKGAASFLFYLINTIVMCLPLLWIALIKLLIPIAGLRTICDRMLIFIATSWISVNGYNSDLFNSIKWDVSGMESLEMDGWYLVLSNHQSWTDILVLQKVFNRKIPFLKFFLKKELIWVPLLGLAWWALDFPFMRRYSRKFLEKHPNLKGKDMESTRRACEKFKTLPVSVMNFVEGTRFTKAKHDKQKSPYDNLLKPRGGGIGFVLGAMGESIHKLVDVTIVYPQGAESFWGFISGRVKHVIVDVKVIPVTDKLKGDYFSDSDFRDEFCEWLNNLWAQKDRKISSLMKGSSADLSCNDFRCT